jgi:hypothetical protein
MDEGKRGLAEWQFCRVAKIQGARRQTEVLATFLRLVREWEWAGKLPFGVGDAVELVLDVTPTGSEPHPDRRAAIKVTQWRLAKAYAAKKYPTFDQVSGRGMALYIQRETGEKFSRRTAERWLDRRDFREEVQALVLSHELFVRAIAEQKRKWNQDAPERARRAKESSLFSEFIATALAMPAATGLSDGR